MAKRKFQIGDQVTLNSETRNKTVYVVTDFISPFYYIRKNSNTGPFLHRRAEQLSLAESSYKFEVGQKIKIVKNLSTHCFNIGDLVTIKKIVTYPARVEYRVEGIYPGSSNWLVDQYLTAEEISHIEQEVEVKPFYITGPKQLVKAACCALVEIGYKSPRNDAEDMPQENAILCSNYEKIDTTFLEYIELYANSKRHYPTRTKNHKCFSLPKDWNDMLDYCKKALEAKKKHNEKSLFGITNKNFDITIKSTGEIEAPKGKGYNVDELKSMLDLYKLTPVQCGSYTAEVIPTERFIRIGCKQEDVRISPEEIKLIISTYEKLTGE